MTMPIPKYIRAANIQDNTIRYEWDDWKTLPAAETPDTDLVRRLEGVSQRAVLAFMCGTAEWMYHRLSNLCDDPAPQDYLEAAWSSTIDSRYIGYGTGDWWQTYSSGEWLGPVKRPIDDVLGGIEIAVQQLALERIDPSDQAGWIAAITVYIMPNPAPYKKWCEQVMERFESLYPRDPEDALGDVVPRQAVDTEFDFHVEQTEVLINQFLASLDYRTNRFLSSPEGMLKGDVEGSFKGTPYVFSIEVDHMARVTSKGHEGHKHDE